MIMAFRAAAIAVLLTCINSALASTQPIWDWRFGEATAGHQIKDSAHGLTASLEGKTQWDQGPDGAALSFNGETGHLQVNGEGYTTIKGNEGLTLRSLIRVVKAGQTQPLVYAAPTLEVEIRRENGEVSFNLIDAKGNAVRCTGVTSVNDGRWHEVVAVRDPESKTLRVYVDGRLDTEVVDKTAGNELPIPNTITIAGRPDMNEMFGGTISSLSLATGVAHVTASARDVPEDEIEHWSLANDKLEMRFAGHDGVVWLQSLLDRETGTQFIDADPSAATNLWRVAMRSDEWPTQLDASQGELDVKASDTRLTFTWNKIGLDDNHATVVMTVDLPADSAMSQWKIDINHNSDKFGVWTVQCPSISNLARLDDDPLKNYLAMPTGLNGGAGEGQLKTDPWNTVEVIPRTYPSYIQSMQFNAWYGPQAGLYLATHDGKMNLKAFQFKPTPMPEGEPLLSYNVLHYPADAGVGGTQYEQPYPAMVGVFHGDWYDAAQIYREWALDQVWARKGPLHQREDISPWIKDGAWWTIMATDRIDDGPPYLREKARTLPLEEVYAKARSLDIESNVERVEKAFDYFGYPMILWSAEWYDGGGDLSPPRYVPLKNLPEFLDRLKSAVPDAYFSAHMQAKRFSVQVLEWNDEVQQSIEKRPDGSWSLEAFGAYHSDKDQHAYPCWATEFWQKDWQKRSNRLASYGLQGFHMDELGSYTDFYEQCFNRDHGHPVGGGTLYSDTRRKMVTIIRDAAREQQPGFALHHEAMCEVYIDVADLQEVCTSPSNNNIPLWEAVYHDYSFVMGRRIYQWFDRNLFQADGKTHDEPFDEFTSSFAQTFVWGNQPSWTRIDIVDYAPKVAAFIKKSMDVRYRVMPYLNVGQMMRPLLITEPLPTVKRIWQLNDTPEHVLPVIMNSVWKAADGTIGIVLFNHTDQPQQISYQRDLAECGLEGSLFKISRIDTVEPTPVGDVIGTVLERTDEVEPYSVIVLKVETAEQ